MFSLLLIGLLTPLAGFLSILLMNKSISRNLTGIIACSTVFISFLCFVTILYIYTDAPENKWNFILYPWIHIGQLNANFQLHLDSLSILMTLIITGIGFLIHVYANGYMDHDEDYARFFACLNFFIFAMLLLVTAGDLLVLFLGWEGVGLASYLLIGFWYQRPSAEKAATKAFVVNRIGDWGFLVGLLLTYSLFGTTNTGEVLQKTTQAFALGAPIISLLCLLYFFAATGKSAQIPLHVWLPDAMEGPTPVSALIHAATMVTAGVYLVVRMHPAFLLAPSVLNLVGYIGAATALMAALSAMAQTDLKRVLAYSTVSQLGYMFLACGIGAFYAAMFHLTMHAFVKGLLFLAAGNVVHMLHGTTNMNEMGGLAKKFPKTHWFFLIGVLALSGVPPLAAFFSKDLILEQEFKAGYDFLFIVALFAAVLTAFYMTRAYILTFAGPLRLSEKLVSIVREAPKIMLIPVGLLALLSLIGGFLGFAMGHHPEFEIFLEESDVKLPVADGGFHFSPEMWLSFGGALIGIGAAVFMYLYNYKQTRKPLALLKNSFYIDTIYEKIIINPLKYLSQLLTQSFEPKVIDASLNAITFSADKTAGALQQMQSGQIRSYVAWMAIGVFALIVYFLL